MTQPLTLSQAFADATRVLRTVDPPEAPYPGVLAHSGGRAVLAVEADALRGWAGWWGLGPHVLSPIDVAAGPLTPTAEGGFGGNGDHGGERVGEGGAFALLPWCSLTLDAFLARAGAALDDGEVVTVLVSVLRGWEALRRRALELREPEPAGRWWLTDDGTPSYAAARARADGVWAAGEARGARGRGRAVGAESEAAEIESGARRAATDAAISTLLRLRGLRPAFATLIDTCLDLAERGDFAGAEARAFVHADPAPLPLAAALAPALGSAAAGAVGEAGITHWRPGLDADPFGLTGYNDGFDDLDAAWEEPGPGPLGRVRAVVAAALARFVDRDMAETVDSVVPTTRRRAHDTAGRTAHTRSARGSRSAASQESEWAPRLERARPERPRPELQSVAGAGEAGDAASRRPRGRGPLLVAAAIVIVGVAVGVLWPHGDEAGSAAVVPTAGEPGSDVPGGESPEAEASAATGGADGTAGAPEASAESPATPSAQSLAENGGDGTAAAAGADPVAALDALARVRAACAEPCAAHDLSEVLAEGASEWPAGASSLPASERGIALLDDLGEAAVLRVESLAAAGARPQHVVMEHTREGWRVRSVRDAG